MMRSRISQRGRLQAGARTLAATTVAGLSVLFSGEMVQAVPDRGDAAPPISLTSLSGREISLEDFPGATVALIFGELYHEPTREAMREISEILDEPNLQDEPIAPVLVIAQDKPADELREDAADAGLPTLVLHDVKRQVFGAYKIAVMPSVVIIDENREVVYGVAGKTARFADLVRDSLLLATGQLSEATFVEAIDPSTRTTKSTEEVRADRVTALAEQLARRGLSEMAEEKFAEALEYWPNHVGARLGLGKLFLRKNRLAEAESQFRKALVSSPDSVEASLGLGIVQTLRGGDELADAEEIAAQILARNPSQPRAHYLLGLVHEQRDELEQAAASYKRAAELLMER